MKRHGLAVLATASLASVALPPSHPPMVIQKPTQIVTGVIIDVNTIVIPKAASSWRMTWELSNCEPTWLFPIWDIVDLSKDNHTPLYAMNVGKNATKWYSRWFHQTGTYTLVLKQAGGCMFQVEIDPYYAKQSNPTA